MAKQIGNPELVETWGSEGDVSEPFLTKKRQGWLFQEQPASSIANWLVNTQQQKINHLLKNGVSEWSTNTNYTRGAIVKHANTAWKARHDNTASEPAPDNDNWAEVSTLPLIRRPELESPINGESDVATDAPLEASEYAAVYSSDVRDYRRFEVDTSGGDFSSPVVTNEVDADDWTVDPILSTDTGYIWRCKDVSVRGDESEWSDAEGFVTGSVFVTTPSITAPADNAVDIGETPTFTSSAFAVTGGSDTHVASYWRVYQGTTEVWASGRTTSDLENITIPSGILQDSETVYTVQVKHEGDTYGTSSWSAVSTFTTLDSFTRIATPSITSPSDGEIDIDETPTFTSSAFSVINGSDTHIASAWEVYTPNDALVWQSGRTTANRTSISMPSGVLQDGETSYKVRVRHESDTLGVSEWSNTVDFVTLEFFANIAKPAITAPLDNETEIDETPTFESTAFSVNDGTDTHVASKWEVYTQADALVWQSFRDTSNITAITIPAGELSDGEIIYKVRVQHEGNTLGVSEWSDLVPFQTKKSFGSMFVSGAGNTPLDEVLKFEPSNLSLKNSLGGTGVARALAFGSDGFLYAGAGNSEIFKIDTDNMTSASTFTGTAGVVLSLAYGTDDFLYAGFNSTNDLLKINTSTMAQADSYGGQNGSIFALAFGDDGFLYTCGLEDWVRRIDPSDMTENDKLNIGEFSYSIAYGSDDFLYVGDGSGDVRKIDPTNMTQSSSVSTGTGNVDALAYGPDGFLYAGTADGKLRKINPSTMAIVTTITAHSAGITALAYGEDGILYSVSDDGFVKQFNPSDMVQLRSFDTNDQLFSVAFEISIPDLLGFTA